MQVASKSKLTNLVKLVLVVSLGSLANSLNAEELSFYPQLPSFSLDATPEIYDPTKFFYSLKPEFKDCQLKKSEENVTNHNHYHRYEIYYQNTPILNSYFFISIKNRTLNLFKASLPKWGCENIDSQFRDFSSLREENPEIPAVRSAKKIYFESNDQLHPAYQAFSTIDDRNYELIIDARNAEVLQRQISEFDFARAQVFPVATKDTVSMEEIPFLDSSEFLENDFFIIHGADEHRARSENNTFPYSPYVADEANQFDEVQSFYGVSVALKWFMDRFAYQLKDRITIRLGKGPAGNARYSPDIKEIQIGESNEQLSNLARDSDVIIHEFAHHIIYRYLNGKKGEPAMLHEGTADYFAYAINADPYLAESTREPYLRTAILGEGDRYDLPENSDSSFHSLGQYWSAVLWELRGKLGESFDHSVYHMLRYLGPTSGIKDASLGLFNADRDLNPTGGDYGKNKCLIMTALVKRGFAVFIEELGGNDCGLDLEEEAIASRELSNQKEKPKHSRNFTIFGKPCGVALNHRGNTALFWLLLLLPLLLLSPGAARTTCSGFSRRL